MVGSSRLVVDTTLKVRVCSMLASQANISKTELVAVTEGGWISRLNIGSATSH